jgi:cell volume regulation protein A
VLTTAGVVAVAAHLVVDLSWTTSLLLGAAVSSTDAAAVFASLRGTNVRRRLAAILEAESGLNDPFAALLVIGLVEWSTTGDFGTSDGLVLLAQQAGIGVAGGMGVGLAGVWLLRRLRLPSAGLAPVITVAVALAGAVGVAALNGSGLLAAYLIGLVIGDARIPHAAVVRGFLQGAAWLAQLGLFVLLGLLVTPSRMLDEGPAPILVAVVLVLVARPLSVLLCATPFGLPLREQGFLAWAGLRGGVPIVLATFPVAAGVPGALRVFDAVFFVVVLSVAAQGLTMRWAARRLDLIEQHPVPRLAEIDSATLTTLHSELVELRAEDLGIRASTLVRDAELPGAAIIVAIRRGAQIVRPRGSSNLAGDDHLYLLVASGRLSDVQTPSTTSRACPTRRTRASTRRTPADDPSGGAGVAARRGRDVLVAVGLEARTAAAGGDRVGVVDREPLAHQAVDEVDLGAAQVGQAEPVDDDFDAVLVDDLVAGLGLAVEAERVLQARATAALHRDPQRKRLGVLAHECEHVLRCALGEPDHELIVPPAGRRERETL